MVMAEVKVTVGEQHQPSQSTIDRANALKEEGNKLLQGESSPLTHQPFDQVMDAVFGGLMCRGQVRAGDSGVQ
jgi:hypothetical protein